MLADFMKTIEIYTFIKFGFTPLQNEYNPANLLMCFHFSAWILLLLFAHAMSLLSKVLHTHIPGILNESWKNYIDDIIGRALLNACYSLYRFYLALSDGASW